MSDKKVKFDTVCGGIPQIKLQIKPIIKKTNNKNTKQNKADNKSKKVKNK